MGLNYANRPQHARIRHHRMVAQRQQFRSQLLLNRRHLRRPVLFVDQLQAFDCHRTGQRIAHKRRTMHKAARRAAADGIGDVARGQGGGERQGAAGQRLAET